MKVAWFRPTLPQPADPLDDTAALVAELRSTHTVDVFTAASAPDFVRIHVRAPYDTYVYELDNTHAHAFIWAYLFHYGGVLLLRALTLHDSRAAMLERERRLPDYISEFTFNEARAPRPTGSATQTARGSWPMLRAPLLASRIAVVAHAHVARALQEEYPEARVRFAPTGVVQGAHAVQRVQAAPVIFGTLSNDRIEVIHRALARARNEGAAADLLADPSAERTLQHCDVVVALRWPSFGEPQTPALAGMAAGKPVVVLDTDHTADWPALDPQTWRPRGLVSETPIAVSIDLRDEEHSLMLSIRRLSSDAALRTQLGSAAHDWWRTHATVAHATDAWGRILSEAASLDPPAHPAGWPAHLTADL